MVHDPCIILIHKIMVPTLEWAGGIATELGAGRSGVRIPVVRNFPPVQTGPGAHPASYKMGTESFPGVKYNWGVTLNPHPLLVPWSWKSRAIPLPTIWATTGPVTGSRYLFTFYQHRNTITLKLGFIN